mgnify:CR=1 FL=1
MKPVIKYGSPLFHVCESNFNDQMLNTPIANVFCGLTLYRNYVDCFDHQFNVVSGFNLEVFNGFCGKN